MASKAIKTIINCGTTQISASVFSADGATLVLEKHILVDLHYDYSKVKEEWAGAVIEALPQIVDSGLKPQGEVVLIVPGHMLLTHNLTMAQMPDPKMRARHIVDEASQHMPFPLEDLIWDEQMISSDGIEENVLVFGLLRGQIVDFTKELMRRTKLKPSRYQPATNLEYQAYRYMTMGQADLPPTLLVNVGAYTTNLTFVHDRGFAVSNFAVGGNFISQKLAEATGIPFIAAEKKKNAYFSGELQFAQDDPTAATISAAADAFARRIQREINLRLLSFRKANNGVGPAKILISGRGSRTPGFVEKLSSLMRLPIEPLDVRPFITVAPGAVAAGTEDEQLGACELQESVGEAATLVIPDLKGVDLFPPEIAAAIEFKRKLPFLAVAGACFALAPWPIFAHFSEVGKGLEQEKKAQKVAIQKLEATEKFLADKEKEAEKLKAYVEKLTGVLDERYRWNGFLAETQKTLEALHSIQTKDEDGEPVVSNDRYLWLDSLSVSRKLVPATEDAPARVVSDAVVTFAMLVPEVDADHPVHDSGAFDARRKVILEALKQADFVDPSAPIIDKPDFGRPNLPMLTVTLRLKSDKGL